MTSSKEKNNGTKKLVGKRKSRVLKDEFKDLYGWQVNGHPEPDREMSEELFEASVVGLVRHLD